MQSVKFLKQTPYKKTFRTEQICGIYDLQPESILKKQFDFDIDLTFDWQIGVIVGTSGSGKTSLAKKLFKDNYVKDITWESKSSFVDEFDKKINVKDIIKCLGAIGFASPPLWLLPYDALSTGQQFRVNVVRALLESKDLVCFDEFTSVVDRQVAKIGSHCINKFVRKTKKRFIAVSCHYDILEWLEPDWVFDVNKNELFRGRLRRPELNIEVYKSEQQVWKLFKEYHYLNTSINPTAQCFVALLWDKPVAISSVIHFPHPTVRNIKKAHRTVVLPDYQGMSIGNKLSDFVGEYYTSKGYTFLSTTSQPSMIYYRNKSKNWVVTRKPSHVGKFSNTSKFKKPLKRGVSKRMRQDNSSRNRITCSFRYVL